MIRRGFCYLVIFLLGWSSIIWGQEKKALESFDVLASQNKVLPGDHLGVALKIKIAKDYHFYGYNVKKYAEFLIPIQVEVKLPAGFSLVKVQYQKPHFKKDPNLNQDLPMYEGEMVVLVVIKIPTDWKGKTLKIEGALKYQACDQGSCLASTEEPFSLSLEVASSAGKIQAQNQKLFGLYPEVAELIKRKESSLPKPDKKPTEKDPVKLEKKPAPKDPVKEAPKEKKTEKKDKPQKDDPAFGIPGEKGPSSEGGGDVKVIEKIGLMVSQTQIRPGDRFVFSLEIGIKKGFHFYGHNVKKYVDYLTPIKLTVNLPKGLKLLGVLYGEPHMVLDPNENKKIPMYEKNFQAYAVLEGAADLKAETLKLDGVLDYQACDASTCQMPAKQTFLVQIAGVVKDVPVQVATGFWKDNKEVMDLLKGGKVASADNDGPSKTKRSSTGLITSTKDSSSQKTVKKAQKKSDFEKKLEKSLFLALLFAFLWGLASAFLPCVYPLIPITISYFSAQSKGSQAVRVSMGFFYMLGISGSFTALVMVATVVMKQSIGSILANWWFVQGLLIFFVVLALSMFGLFEIRLPSSITDKLQGAQRGGVFGALIMGSVLGLVAAPCVAGPFALILAFAMKGGDVWIASSATLCYGLGLGAPFMALAIFSSSLKAMPRAGAWMENVKYIMGFVMIGAGIYFEQNSGFISDEWAFVFYGVLLILSAAFMGAFNPITKESSRVNVLTKSFSVIALLLGGYLFLGGLHKSGVFFEKEKPLIIQKKDKTVDDKNAKVSVATEVQWIKDPAAVADPAKYAREKKQNMFVFFSAVWCTYCKGMKKTVFKDPEVIQYIEQHFIPVYADVDKLSGAQELKNKLKIADLPGFAFYNQKGELVEVVGKKDTAGFLKVLKKVAGK